MFLRALICLLALLLVSPISTSAQTTVARDPQAVLFLNQSVAVLTGGRSVTDVTLQAAATYIAGSDEESGAAAMLARPQRKGGV